MYMIKNSFAICSDIIYLNWSLCDFCCFLISTEEF